MLQWVFALEEEQPGEAVGKPLADLAPEIARMDSMRARTMRKRRRGGPEIPSATLRIARQWPPERGAGSSRARG